MRTTTAMSVVLRGAAKRYGDTTALENVNLNVGEGEFVALLGASGSGKTTLLRAVAGLVELDEGSVHIGDTDVTRMPTQRRPIGMVFQSYALFPNMTVADNIGFSLRVRRQPRNEIQARVLELLGLVGLDGLGARYPTELSGGQQQRVALARALAPEPRVLLLDEPLSALDAVIRTTLRDEIRSIQLRLGLTALYVTHDQSEALAIADRVAVMSRGRIIECSSPERLYLRPIQHETARFVGGRNVLNVKVGVDRRVRLGSWLLDVSVPMTAGPIVTVSFVPEDVVLQAHGTPAIITMITFLGATTRLHLRVGEHLVFSDQATRELPNVKVGDEVTIGIHSSSLTLFPLVGGSVRSLTAV